MVTLSIVGLVWAIIGIVFVWMIVHYGISQGKQRDVAKEFEAKEEDKQLKAKEARDRQAS